MNKNDFHIRDFLPSDYQEVINLWQKLELSYPKRGDNLETINLTLKHGGKLLLLIDKQKNKIIGTSWITTDFRRTYLHHFGIDIEYQGKGLANFLLEETFKYVLKLGFQVKLEVHKNNFKAINLYEKYGFKNLGDYKVMIIRDINKIKEFLNNEPRF